MKLEEDSNKDIKDMLDYGEWVCDYSGAKKTYWKSKHEEVTIIACPHLIRPEELLLDIETETEKVKLAFYKYKKWYYITIPRAAIANASKIVELANRKIEVNSTNAKHLVNFLADTIANNLHKIPMSRTSPRLGWTAEGFIPYIEDIKFDGDNGFKSDFECIAQKGNYEEWKKQICIIRAKNKITQTVFAASFASVLLKKFEVSPFIIHLWGGTGVGKTVVLMLAMSIWGNPEKGKLVKSLNSTSFAMRKRASFLADIPFAGDELQTIQSKDGDYNQLIMDLTEGIDRGRGTKDGNVEVSGTWNCCFITTGEEPITKSNSGGGTKNRVLEINTEAKLIDDGNFSATFARGNFGWAGKEFIENLPSDDDLRIRYREIFSTIIEMQITTEKQAIIAASILLADELATSIIFKDGEGLKLEDITKHIKTNDEVDISQRAYDWTVSWIAANSKRFCENDREIWGKLDDSKDFCYINKQIYTDHLSKNRFDFDAVAKKMADRDQIKKTNAGKYASKESCHGIRTYYVKIMLPKEENKTVIKQEEQFLEQIGIAELPW